MAPRTSFDPHPAMWPPARLQAIVFALTFVLGICEAAQGRFQYPDIPHRLFWPEALARALPSWFILAMLFPALYALALRFPVDGRHWRRSLPMHWVAGTAFVLLHLGGSAFVASLRGVTTASFRDAFVVFLTRYMVSDYFVYGAVVAIVQIHFHRSEVRRREELAARLQADLAEARLAALRNQLQPHFLFNALNAISALALTGDRDTLVRAVDALSGLLRIVLDETTTATTRLSTELEFVDRYAAIQSIRFGDRFRLERDIDPSALDASVPTLLLQPLLENALEHGLGARPGPGWVAIRARRDARWLQLEVEDSGPGFTSDTSPRGRGVGLANTRARLAQLYGTGYELECRNAARGGAWVVVRIPWSAAPADVALGADA